MKDPLTGRLRGFGFVMFQNLADVDKVAHSAASAGSAAILVVGGCAAS